MFRPPYIVPSYIFLQAHIGIFINCISPIKENIATAWLQTGRRHVGILLIANQIRVENLLWIINLILRSGGPCYTLPGAWRTQRQPRIEAITIIRAAVLEIIGLKTIGGPGRCSKWGFKNDISTPFSLLDLINFFRTLLHGLHQCLHHIKKTCIENPCTVEKL